jgi:hypothetical protein
LHSFISLSVNDIVIGIIQQLLFLIKLFYGTKYKNTVETAAEAFNRKKRKPEKLEAGAAQENIQN